jgi:hypothetical protein
MGGARIVLQPARHLAHLAGHFTAAHVARGAGQAVLLGLVAAFAAELIEALSERVGALGELLLLAGQPARGVLIAARHGAAGLFADLPLARGKLARFELRVADGAAPFVGPGLAQRALHALQPLERTRALTARGVRILAA